MTPHVGRGLARRLEQGSAIRVLRPKTDIVFFLQPNILPGARGMAWLPDGTPIDANPLADVRVRRAMSLAIDRDFLVSHALHGRRRACWRARCPRISSAPTPRCYPDPYDPALARHLLSGAGYASGLTLAVAGMDDVESDDRQLLRTLRAQLAGVGIRLKPTFGPLRDFARYDPQSDLRPVR